MKTKRQTTRPVTGILLTAGSIALLAAPACGTLGRGLSQLLYIMIGTPGVALLAVTLCLCGTVCLVPAGTTGRLLTAYRKRRQQSRYTAIQVIPPRALSRSEELRQAMEAEGYDPADVQRVLPQMVKLSEGIEHEIRCAAQPRAKVVPLRSVPDDTRVALKSLGYVYGEIDAILPQLDRGQDTAGQIRQALKLLRRAS